MNQNNCVMVFNIVLCLIGLCVAISDNDGIGLVTALFALVFGSIACGMGTIRAYVLVCLTALLLLITNSLSITVVSYDTMVMRKGIDNDIWGLLIGTVHAVVMVPLVMVIYIALSSRFGAVFNWAMVRGLSVFIAMGVQVPGFVLEYIMHNVEYDTSNLNNGYIIYGFMTTLLFLILSSYLLSGSMRKKHLVLNANGLEVRA
ncbi:MAG: hypothetical protein MJZ68_03495 [archaeon]|nr:hypothetical protein [archaeon]